MLFIMQNIRMWIKRKYEKTLKDLFKQFPVVVLTGARQVGKTALVQRLFPGFSYVSLDLPSLSEQAEQNPHDFLAGHEEPLIIDEVQYAPSLFRHLKGIVDKKKTPGRFILTGSQNFSLMQGISESLAGRCAVLNMLNLSFRELKETVETADADSYLFKGGFPELYEKPEIDSRFWYAAYLATYLERDVRNISTVGNLRDFDRFLRASAIRTGQILSYSELARDVGIAPNTAKKWISILQASGQIVLIEPYHRNLGKRLIKSPKLYMCDTGLAAFLMGFEKLDEVMRHPVAGALWETHVVMQVVRHYFSRGRHLPLWYWRTVHGAEVDLLIEKGGRFVAVEAKTSESPDKKALKGIQALQRFYGNQSLISGYIASRTLHAYPLSDTVKAVPGSLIDQYIP
ncbi:MAG TPA: ATP-binding protein [Desulfobacteraceae bacterium]|nr:ATP-binding protein [Desulfobacteraceae bacterium]